LAESLEINNVETVYFRQRITNNRAVNVMARDGETLRKTFNANQIEEEEKRARTPTPARFHRSIIN